MSERVSEAGRAGLVDAEGQECMYVYRAQSSVWGQSRGGCEDRKALASSRGSPSFMMWLQEAMTEKDHGTGDCML